ncbi:outer membrane protein [Paraburkholderia sp. BCC1885]|uniref:outer membrane protein n=1 Tax=Paraburkholderia sp. BCC1885 TaxID=2562669 RepID=UPI001183C318|nr:outer membrane beta-barrel protein [Paraburkholderia sp. BCC1885]
MMKMKKIYTAATIIVLATLSQAHAQTAPQNIQPQGSEFSGPYVGFKLGENFSSASGHIARPEHSTTFPGLTAGYGFDVGPLLLGAEAFADLHHGSVTYKDAGIDARIGVPMNHFMPYARVGFTGSWPETRLHVGLGVEYKVLKQVGISGEWTTDTSNTSGTRRKNDSVTVGLNYHF